MNNPLYLIAGYGVTFVAIAAYLLRLRRLERNVSSAETRSPSAAEAPEPRA